MLSYIKGVVKEVNKNKVVIDNNGLGYEVNVLNESKYVINEECLLYTCLVLKEEVFIINGFDNKEEKDVFVLLTSISGIGNKIAMNILRTYNVEILSNIVNNEDVNSLSRVSGVTNTLALQIIVALKLKLKKYNNMPINSDYKNDLFVYKALQDFQYSKKDIEAVLKECKNHSNSSALLKEALQLLNKGKNYGK